jgi:hypothetical protein
VVGAKLDPRHYDTRKRTQRSRRLSIASGRHRSRQAAAQGHVRDGKGDTGRPQKGVWRLRAEKRTSPEGKGLKACIVLGRRTSSERLAHGLLPFASENEAERSLRLFTRCLFSLKARWVGRVPHLSRSYRSHRFCRYFSRWLPRRPLMKTRESAHRPHCRQGQP